MYVPDASRSVGVCTSLSRPELRTRYIADRSAPTTSRSAPSTRQERSRAGAVSPRARANAHADRLGRVHAARARRHSGREVLRRYDLAELARYIDWSPFFQTWDLAGSYPKILQDPVVGEAARNVLRRCPGDARAHRSTEKWLTANGVVTLLPAASVGDDIEIYTDESRSEVAMV